MKVKNITSKVKFIKLNEEFSSVEPRECIEIPDHIYHNTVGFEEVKVDKPKKETKKEKVVGDLDGDGKVTKKDASIAGKAQAAWKKVKKQVEKKKPKK